MTNNNQRAHSCGHSICFGHTHTAKSWAYALHRHQVNANTHTHTDIRTGKHTIAADAAAISRYALSVIILHRFRRPSLPLRCLAVNVAGFGLTDVRVRSMSLSSHRAAPLFNLMSKPPSAQLHMFQLPAPAAGGRGDNKKCERRARLSVCINFATVRERRIELMARVQFATRWRLLLNWIYASGISYSNTRNDVRMNE